MSEVDVAKLIGQAGFGVALLALIYIIGSRMVAAMDRMAAKDDAQTAAINELRTDIAVLTELLHRVIGGVADRRGRASTPPTGTGTGGTR
jgi:hypothetical protein